MKEPKVIDIFPFYNELDMLEYRLSVLKDVVDLFVIIEAKQTFTGNPKPLFFQENCSRFSEHLSKVVSVPCELPYKAPTIDISANQQWQNEMYQRNLIAPILESLNLEPDDLFMILDVDEIPDPDILKKIKKGEIKVHFNILEQDFYNFNLNTKYTHKWKHPKIVRYDILIHGKISPHNLRQEQFVPCIPGGWHLSYFGDEQFIQNKLLNFSHQEYNEEKFTSISSIKSRVQNQTELWDRDFKIEKIPVCENSYLPPRWQKYLMNFALY
jgi:beta-1,4-mannosyl-glycoprotein beta-1,4-N-acetylglucosaminyltransferase